MFLSWHTCIALQVSLKLIKKKLKPIFLWYVELLAEKLKQGTTSKCLCFSLPPWGLSCCYKGERNSGYKDSFSMQCEFSKGLSFRGQKAREVETSLSAAKIQGPWLLLSSSTACAWKVSFLTLSVWFRTSGSHLYQHRKPPKIIEEQIKHNVCSCFAKEQN